ncbi:hypothetical protein [Nonlabens sp.]|uniref:hypothetical protein n=1 Tax=Nonlabens sp. TaxID=1888209 RepID=UPI001BCCBA8B|nr:hypothetical protein [Nonlabens sp.]
MKKLFIILITIISISCNSQTNNLTAYQYQNIKIQNIYLSDILGTGGDSSSLQNLFSDNFTIENGNEPGYWKQFESSSMYCLFQNGVQDEFRNNVTDYQLTNLRIKDDSKTLFINGLIVKIGDNISVLGNVNTMNNPATGEKKVVFRIGSEVIRISYTTITNTITLIEYEFFN